MGPLREGKDWEPYWKAKDTNGAFYWLRIILFFHLYYFPKYAEGHGGFYYFTGKCSLPTNFKFGKVTNCPPPRIGRYGLHGVFGRTFPTCKMC